jgi:hypothetical protein
LKSPSATRKRIMHAIKHREELTGQDRELALFEAYRSRRLAPTLLIILSVLAALLLTDIALSLVNDIDRVQVALAVVQLGLLALIAINQLIFYRRASAYLNRFGSDPSSPTIATGDR